MDTRNRTTFKHNWHETRFETSNGGGVSGGELHELTEQDLRYLHGSRFNVEGSGVVLIVQLGIVDHFTGWHLRIFQQV